MGLIRTSIAQSYGLRVWRLASVEDPAERRRKAAVQSLRELLSNAIDAEKDGHPMSVFTGSWSTVITSEGVTVDPAHLALLGVSGSREDADKIGQFGEGFLLACLVLVSHGFHVVVDNGGVRWTPEFTEHLGEQVLAFRTRKLRKPRSYFSVGIEGISPDVVAEARQCFRQGRGQPRDTRWDGSLLLAPEYAGRIYAKGVLVDTDASLAFGYDFTDIEVNRDRDAVDRFALKNRISDLLEAVLREHQGLADEIASRLFTADSAEVNTGWSRVSRSSEVQDALVRLWVDAHGEDVLPVYNDTEKTAADEAGVEFAMTSELVADMLRAAGFRSPQDAARAAGEDVVKTYFCCTPDIAAAWRIRGAVQQLVGHGIEVELVQFANTATPAKLDGNRLYLGLEYVTKHEPRWAIAQVSRLMAGHDDCATAQLWLCHKLADLLDLT